MTAEDKFKEGQSVRMTAKAVSQGLDGTSHKRTGTVKGFPKQGFGDLTKLVYVIRTGNKTKEQYHMDFWEPDE